MHTKTILYLDRVRGYGFEGNPLGGDIRFFTHRDRSDWDALPLPSADVAGLRQLADNHLLQYTKQRFNAWYPGLMLTLLSLRQGDPAYFDLVLDRLRLMLDAEQRFVLGIIGLPELLPSQAIQPHTYCLSWPRYAYLRYLMGEYRRGRLSQQRLKTIITKSPLQVRDLLAELPAIPWSPILSPCQILDEAHQPYPYPIGFIQDIDLLAQLGLMEGVRQAATYFFSVFPQRQDFHVRLWLYGFVSRKLFEHRQFRAPLMQLTYYEKNRFYRIAHAASQRRFDQRALDQLASCEAFFLPNGDQRYEVPLDKLYFRKGQLCLKTAPGYLLYYHDDRLDTDLNGIDFQVQGYQRAPILDIIVREDDIIQVYGLDIVLALRPFISNHQSDMDDFTANNLVFQHQNSTLLPESEHINHVAGPASWPAAALLRGLNDVLKQILHH